jgi:hypothetical protein
MDRSMYINPDSKEHFPERIFPKWNQLTWLEKLSAAVKQEDCCSVSNTLSYHHTAEAQPSSFDPELPWDKRYSKHFQEMVRGEMSGGMEIASNSSRRQHLLLLRASRSGKEIDQSFEECEICGRRCVIPGSGMCDRCKDFELEKDMLDIKEDTLKPDTYLGDSRALLRHAGFDHYIPVPQSHDQTMRLKISDNLSSFSVDERRKKMKELAQLLPQQFVQPHDPLLKSSDSNIVPASLKREPLFAICSTSDFTQMSDSAYVDSVENVVADLKMLHRMIKSNRFDDVQGLLVRASVMQDISRTDKAVE